MSDTRFHIHDDIDELFSEVRIPLTYKSGTEVYVMQENRIVFVGTRLNAKQWVKRNDGQLCKQWPAIKPNAAAGEEKQDD